MDKKCRRADQYLYHPFDKEVELCPKMAARSDVVVLDPLRKGCDCKLFEDAAQMEPERIA